MFFAKIICETAGKFFIDEVELKNSTKNLIMNPIINNEEHFLEDDKILSNQDDVFVNTILNFYVTSHTFAISLIAILTMILYGLRIQEAYFIPKSYLQDVIEILNGFLQKLVKAQWGTRNQIFYPDLFFCFLVLIVTNYMTLIPYSVGLTSHLSLGFFIGLYFFFNGLFSAVANHQISYIKIFSPPKDVPFSLGLFLSLIELISFLMRIPSLVVRLFANMLAGHLLLEILGDFAYLLACKGSIAYFSIFVGFLSLIVIIKLFVSFLQAYILIYLSVIYIKEFSDGPLFKH